MINKVQTMKDAIAAHVRDGDTVVIEGFTHLICFRRRPRDHSPAPQGPHDLPARLPT